MPYDVKEHDGEKCPADGDGFDVVNTESEEVRAHHEQKENAERQVRVLTELEKEE
jgi:hypothetical protein